MISTIFSHLLSAVPVADPGSDVFGWLLNTVKWAVEQFQARNFMPAVGAVVMVLVFAARKLFANVIESKHLTWLSMILGMLASLAASLLNLNASSSPMDILGALSNGLMVGAAASGFWSLLGKKLLGDKPADPAAPAPPPAS